MDKKRDGIKQPIIMHSPCPAYRENLEIKDRRVLILRL